MTGEVKSPDESKRRAWYGLCLQHHGGLGLPDQVHQVGASWQQDQLGPSQLSPRGQRTA